jgi:uncharacterized membrane protein YedE/YeeE
MGVPGRAGIAKAASAFVSGLVFAVGLGLAGMTQPAKVIAFLDVAGHWDASLAWVMLGAVGAHATFLRFFARRVPRGGSGTGSSRIHPVDRPLLIGSAIFGLGWGMGGFCPGPAVVSLVTGWHTPLLFVASMLAGMAAHALAFRPPSGASARPASGA